MGKYTQNLRLINNDHPILFELLIKLIKLMVSNLLAIMEDQ